MSKARQQANLSSDGNLFADISNDRVGIGSVVPTHKLHVAGTSKFDDDVKFEGTTAAKHINWDKSNDYLMVSDNARIVFGNSGDLSIRHLSSDNKSYVSSTTNDVVHEFNVGKNWSLTTTAAEKRIHCPAESTDKSVELYWNGSKKLSTTNTGAVVTGILTATSFKLTDGSIVGGVDSDAQRNTKGGTNAGDSFSGTDATDNTLLGYDAGTAITTGDKNTLVGSYAGDSVSTSANITAIGYYAASTVSTQSVWTGITAVGSGACKTSVGVRNTVVGFDALKNGSSAAYNSVLGNEAAVSSDGSNNVVIGDTALRYGTSSASYNIVLGRSAFNGHNSNHSGSHSISIGYQSLNNSNRTTAWGNVAIGSSSGKTLTTGNNNIIIGNSAEPTSATTSNEITLGNSDTTHLRIPGIGVTASSSKLTANNYDLSAIDKSISDTAVDIFVYDTRKDSDGGAWRKRTSHTTWYNETFDSKRGSKKEFPAVAVIVAENDTLTIYDGDDPEMPMWMVFDSGGANGNHMAGRTNEHTKKIHMLNGLLCVGRDYFGIHMINFIDDRARFKENGYDTPYLLPIGTNRNGGNVWALDPNNEGNDLNNDMVNDIAMTVLPNAPIDASTGLPIPTIAVATDIGVTVMTTNDATTWENGKTWDVYMGHTTYDTVSTVQFTKDGKVVYTDHNGSNYGWMYVHDIPYIDTAITVNTESTALTWYDTRDAGSESAQGGHSFADQDGHIYSSGNGTGVKILHTVTAPDDMIYATTTSGVTMIQENRGANRSGLVAHVTHLYNTGWLHGDQKFCLSDIDATDKTNTQTEYDRSIGAKNLTVHGTVTKTAVATGAEMVSWSFGNSNSNYLKQDYTAKLQFGTSSFSVMAWIKMADYSSTGFIFDRADSGGGERIAWYMENDDLKLYTYNGGASEIGNGTVEIGSGHDGKWVFAVETRHSSGLMEAYINGVLRHSQVSTVRNVDNGDAHLIVGGRYNNTSGNEFNGEIALLRMSKSVPSPEQVAKIYNDEKDLFVDNAKCSLYGSSSSITALAHDEDTDTLHVGTSGGRSDFTGLNRINNTTTAVTTVISASNGLIIEQ